MRGDYRAAILDLVRSEFMGPCPDENLVVDGEEIIIADSPLNRYSVGILYPQQQVMSEGADVSLEEGEDETGDHDDGDSDDVAQDGFCSLDGNRDVAKEEPEDDPINLANAYRQSAVSLTFKKSARCKTLHFRVAYGIYAPTEVDDGDKKLGAYRREQKLITLDVDAADLPTKASRASAHDLFAAGSSHLRLAITNRETGDERTKGMYTASLINESHSDSYGGDCSSCFFQVELSVSSDSPFLPLQDSTKSHNRDEDYLNNQLLYRNVRTYGIGHGCAAVWDQHASEVYEISAEFIPSYEVRPIVPASGLDFDMLIMSNQENRDVTFDVLSRLCRDYEGWIEERRAEADGLDPKFHRAAENNIGRCEACLARMQGGLNLLKEDSLTFEAFCLMNEAMVTQQLHYRMPLGKWVGGRKGAYLGLGPDVDPSDRCTWPTNGVYGKWRTFQIAFILMNLRSMRDEDSPERDLVDLIWFPTGGGKTEAYLGLTAFALFARRLNNREDGGVTALMRYTLRLLTTQQFERAASLICACEVIRERMPELLGEERFSIGLWVGKKTTPNTQEDAVEKYNKLCGSADENPFILLKCPWCGAEMGVVENGKRPHVVKGYRTVRKPGRGRSNSFIYTCSNARCHFSAEGSGSLPVYTIDEDVYNNRPSLVIGTVDKFAAITTTSETRNLFGRGERRCSPPDLIIQDELHLISGPLGSMVGFYETAIDELCKDADGHPAKIVGSTATISHAKEQCAALYGRPKSAISQFPPSGIDAGDSFFAIQENDPAKPGRLYAGICSPGCSMAMSVINLYASLLLAPDAVGKDVDKSILDGYQTNLGYFNSLRELGQAATWISGNILENLRAMQARRWRKTKKFKGRNPSWVNHCELTSRVGSSEIPASLKRLEVGLDDEPGSSHPVDVCLATNMVSVGVDIQRLALMTIDGQPKTTSEYIQASSRVGRGDNPGLVFTVYSPMKARDKSHYEDFQHYHSRLYCNVEPTSVTPFSAPLRDRAMKALIVALVRQLCPFPDRDNPQPEDMKLYFERTKHIILDRVSIVDQSELESTRKQVETLLDTWNKREPQRYMSKKTDEVEPLIMRNGSEMNPSWRKDGTIWSVPTSMRSVDSDCAIKGISEYFGGEENE